MPENNDKKTVLLWLIVGGLSLTIFSFWLAFLPKTLNFNQAGNGQNNDFEQLQKQISDITDQFQKQLQSADTATTTPTTTPETNLTPQQMQDLKNRISELKSTSSAPTTTINY